jgi:hypothetical protein
MTATYEDTVEAFNAMTVALGGAGTGHDMLSALTEMRDALAAYLETVHIGDQTITLTGDVTGTGTGEFATAIGANKVTGPMIAASALKLLLFTGVDASGAPADATLTGAAVGDAVVGVINVTDDENGAAHFGSTIATVNKINQLDTDYSTKKFVVLLITKG